MDENKKDLSAVSTETAQPAAPEEERDQALFDAIGKGKKKKKIRRIITTVVILALVAGGITAAVLYGRSKVRQQFGDMTAPSVTAYTVDTGSVNTTVSGSGLLADVDTEKLTLPKGVKVDKVLVEAGDPVAAGQILATVDRSSVLAALKETQDKIVELDGKLRDAAADSVPTYLNTSVAGRVKMVYAQADDDVAACMVEHGALALLSLDGYMAVDLDTDALNPGDKVKVLRADGKELAGTVDQVIRGRATILVTDNGPALDETVTVTAADGRSIGSGALYIHNPLRITGYAGTVAVAAAKENQYYYAGSALFTLKDTAYAANYNALIKERQALEEELLELLSYARAGAVEAPFTGTVSSVEYSDKPVGNNNSNTGANTGSGDMSGGMNYGNYGTAGSVGTTGGDNGSATASSGETALLTLSPDERMSVTITVDETDILALEVGQSAQITINSIGDIFSGEVTEINRSASSQSGVTSYQAVITMPKDPRMMPGMSAKAVVRIQGVAGAILIPEAALHQTRDAAFVYTSYNYETQEFGGAVAVVPGLSNGDMVEIVEGLSEGDTVFYTVVFDPYAYYGSAGDASGGDAWVEMDASAGDAWTASAGDAVASSGDAGE